MEINTQEQVNRIQEIIGYRFNNPYLLLQAYTRRSYANEQGGEDNEVLEFIGDKALDFAVVHYLADRFGRIGTYREYECDEYEGELTKLKSSLVNRNTLSDRIDDLGLSEQEYFFLGNSDIRQHVEEKASVKEDLFEAIIGAVAIDCDWNSRQLFDVVETMLEPDEYLNDEPNYVTEVTNWFLNNGYDKLPVQYYEHNYYFGAVTATIQLTRRGNGLLSVWPAATSVSGNGNNKREARYDVCRKAYEELVKLGEIVEESIQNELEIPNQDEAISQLEILARRGYFEIPQYDFEQVDRNGTQLWRCICMIDGEEKECCASDTSKKKAKKMAAWAMLRYVLENY